MTLLVSRHLRHQLNKPKVGDLSPNSVKQIGRNGINEATYFLPSFPMEPLDERYANARCITDGRWRTENENGVAGVLVLSSISQPMRSSSSRTIPRPKTPLPSNKPASISSASPTALSIYSATGSPTAVTWISMDHQVMPVC